MPKTTFPRLALAALVAGCLLTFIFAALLIRFRVDLRREIRQKIIERDAAVLYPMALLQMEDAAVRNSADSTGDDELLSPVLRGALQSGMLAVAIFDADGNPLRAVPATLLFIDLPVDDYLDLRRLKPISRYHPAFQLDTTFANVDPAHRTAPVLEVLIPLHHRGGTRLAGVARYYIDARTLADELAAIDRQIDRQTAATIGIAAALIALIVSAAYAGLRRAQHMIAERNERLVRANFDLTLAAKVSALGQITSHLLHGLQGSVAGLRAVVAGRDASQADPADWETAAGYTERMQAMIQEAVALLGDSTAQTSYELSGHELADIIRQRNTALAEKKGVALLVAGGFDRGLDSHRGGLLCLIASNLIQNAIEASAPGGNVRVDFRHDATAATLSVADDGPGISAAALRRLFEPGHSGKPGGTGLGLAISQLLARQIGATLALDSTGPAGTRFLLTLPLRTS